jgi:hypothetical protein
VSVKIIIFKSGICVSSETKQVGSFPAHENKSLTAMTSSMEEPLKLLGEISSLRHVWANIPEESTNYAEMGEIESSDNESR